MESSMNLAKSRGRARWSGHCRDKTNLSPSKAWITSSRASWAKWIKQFANGWSRVIRSEIERARALVGSLPGQNEFIAVQGVDHFFAGKLGEVDKAIREWMVTRHPELAPD